MKPLKSRAIRRIIEKEKQRIYTWYERVRKSFYSDLFDSNLDFLNYQEILDHHCKYWKRVCRYYLSGLNYVTPDPGSFLQEFKSVI